MTDRDATVLPLLLRRRADEHPDRPLVTIVGGATLTYREFDQLARRWAAALHGLGVERGDPVLSMLTPSIEAFAAWIGMGWLGAIDTGVNTDYRGRMLEYLLEQSGARVAIVHARYLERFATLASRSRLETVISVQGDGDGPFRVIGVEALLEGVEPMQPDREPRPRDVSCMIYTSGTTGPSKGVLIPWGQMHRFCTGTLPAEDLRDDDVFYSPFPVFHGSGRLGLTLMALSHGHVVAREQFSGSEYWSDIRRYRCTTTAMVGAMSAFVLSQPPEAEDADCPLRRALMLPVHSQYREIEARFGIALSTVYSMTEVGPVFRTGWDIEDPLSCGRPIDDVEVKLVDADDYEVDDGAVGELLVRPRAPWTVTAGYFRMPEATADAWRNGWFHTGDAFRRDARGNYFFVDRFKDAIRRRGENISSFEVEALVNAHPAVAESAAVAVPSEWGEDEVKVVVVCNEGESVSPDALIEFLIPTMPRFMIPRYVEFADSLPKTEAMMRVKKVVLRDAGITDATWDREAAGITLPR